MTKDKEKTLRAAGEHGSWVTGSKGRAGRGRAWQAQAAAAAKPGGHEAPRLLLQNDPKRPVDCTGGTKTLPDAERVGSVLRALSLKRASSARKW